MRRIHILLTFLFLSATAYAQQPCPWLTQGTAATLMGGDVQSTVQVANGEGTCEFSLIQQAGPNTSPKPVLLLQISVGHTPAKECLTGEPLTGIGENSAFCTEKTNSNRRQIIRGRVRNTYFLLTLTSTGTSPPDNTTSRRILEQAGEEVAGSLF